MQISRNTGAQEFVIEVTHAYAFIILWGYEIFIEFESGLPYWKISEEVTPDSRELWAFGAYLAFNKADI